MSQITTLHKCTGRLEPVQSRVQARRISVLCVRAQRVVRSKYSTGGESRPAKGECETRSHMAQTSAAMEHEANSQVLLLKGSGA